MFTVDASDCKFRCWECNKSCLLKSQFFLPDELFYDMILNSLKSTAGMYIAGGGDKDVADDKLKKMAVAIKIAREEYLKQLC